MASKVSVIFEGFTVSMSLATYTYARYKVERS